MAKGGFPFAKFGAKKDKDMGNKKDMKGGRK